VIRPPRLAVFADFPEEGWPSMDLCAEKLLAHLPRDGPDAVESVRVCPPFRRLAGRLPGAGRFGFNADRVLNRFVHFPRHARRIASQFDLFHVVDHSYAALVHALPAGRTGVYCHDLDAIRCLIDPAADPRPRWFRSLARRILGGLQKAAVVFHSTTAVRDQLLAAGLVPPDRLVAAPYGVAEEFTPDPLPGEPALPALGPLASRPWLAHVGSCAPRKRIDVLLDVLARLREKRPDLALVKVGGDWTEAHREQIARLRLADAIVHLRDLTRAELASVYRQAALVLVPSSAEGFGLPVIEALACGAVVVASDIPSLREAGGPAAVHAPVGDVPAWVNAVERLLTDPGSAPPRSERLAWASRFTWTAHAGVIARAYRRLLA
jgi:glycosyltransferase involved in cell wall biosynthesis